MPLWRREALHERLARVGGLTPPPHDPGPHWGEVGIHGVPRPRRWDAVASAEAPGVSGNDVRFVALADGTLLVEEGDAEGDLAPLAAAIEANVPAPYRAEAVRRRGHTWAVAATAIAVAAIRDDVGGDSVEIAVNGGERTIRVDGAPRFGSLPELERLAGRFDAYVIRAARLDGDLWEFVVTPL